MILIKFKISRPATDVLNKCYEVSPPIARMRIRWLLFRAQFSEQMSLICDPVYPAIMQVPSVAVAMEVSP